MVKGLHDYYACCMLQLALGNMAHWYYSNSTFPLVVIESFAIFSVSGLLVQFVHRLRCLFYDETPSLSFLGCLNFISTHTSITWMQLTQMNCLPIRRTHSPSFVLATRNGSALLLKQSPQGINNFTSTPLIQLVQDADR